MADQPRTLADILADLVALDGMVVSVTRHVDVVDLVEALAAHEQRGGSVPWR